MASAGQPRLPPKHLPLHAQRPMSRVAIPTPLPLLAAPEPHPCVSRACAFWQVGHFLQGAGPRTTRRTASASPPTPSAPDDGYPWTISTLHPSPISHNHPSIHLHLLQPSSPLPPNTSRVSHPPQPTHRAHGRVSSISCGDVASLGYIILWCANYLTSGSVVGRVRMPHGPRPWGSLGALRGGHTGGRRDTPHARADALLRHQTGHVAS